MTTQQRKAMFTSDNVPPGGVCLSSFVVIRNGGKVLVGKMTKPEIWIERFFVGEKMVPVYAASNKYLLPARHLAWYESPFETAESVVRDQAQLRVPKNIIHLVDVQSHVRGETSGGKEPPHWDICFVYEAKVSAKTVRELKTPSWFEDFHFVPLSSLSVEQFTRGHGDILEEAGMLRGR